MHDLLQRTYHEIDPSLATVRDGLDQLKDHTSYPSEDELIQLACVGSGLGQNPGDWLERHLLAYDHLKPTDDKWEKLEGLFVFSGELEPGLVERIVRWILASPKFSEMMKRDEHRYRYIDLTISEAPSWQKRRNPSAVYSVRVECKSVRNAGMTFFIEIEQDDLPDEEMDMDTDLGASTALVDETRGGHPRA